MGPLSSLSPYHCRGKYSVVFVCFCVAGAAWVRAGSVFLGAGCWGGLCWQLRFFLPWARSQPAPWARCPPPWAGQLSALHDHCKGARAWTIAAPDESKTQSECPRRARVRCQSDRLCSATHESPPVVASRLPQGATTPTAAKEGPLPSRCGGIGTVDVKVKALD